MKLPSLRTQERGLGECVCTHSCHWLKVPYSQGTVPSFVFIAQKLRLWFHVLFMSLLSRRRTEKLSFLVGTKYDSLFAYISNTERLSSRKCWWIHPSPCMRWVSSVAPAEASLLLFCIFPWSALSTYNQAGVCLLRRAIRDLCRWLRKTRKVVDLPMRKDILSSRLSLWAAGLLVCKQRLLNYTGHVN